MKEDMKIEYINRLSKPKQAAYKAWDTIRRNKQDKSSLDLQMSLIDRVTRDIIKELSQGGKQCVGISGQNGNKHNKVITIRNIKIKMEL